MRSSGGVAPHDLLSQDFKVLDGRETLRTTWQTEELILVQSVLGHAHEGHGVFRGRRFPNTTLDDVVRALRLDPMAAKGARQSLIDLVRGYARSARHGHAPHALVDEQGDPLISVSTLRFLPVEARDVLRGLYLGGLRDDTDVRLEAEREHGVKVGGGRCYHVDFRRMGDKGLSADELVHGEWESRIEEFRREGLIVEGEAADRPGVCYQYIRHRMGPGASDDAAIVGAGFVWGLGTALGVFLADAVDTLEKYVPRYSDQDEAIADEIETHVADLGLSRADVRRLVAIAAAPEDASIEVPDSSLRHLLSIDRRTDLCALEAHILAVQGTPAPSIGLGHERTSSHAFYGYVRGRVKAVMG